MKDWKQHLADYGGKDLQTRSQWYGSIADAYNRVRPRYAPEILARVVDLAQLPANAHLLELGCGPGIATVPFAQLGFSLVSLEPNPEAFLLALQNCAPYPQVTIQNRTFEEWELERDRFDAVLAATAWHWFSPEIAYSKAAATLKEQGKLILLWNTAPQPTPEIYSALAEVYQRLAPALSSTACYEPRATQQEHLRNFSQDILTSGHFCNLIYEDATYSITYEIEDYLALLSTLSQYIALEPLMRNQLLEGLRTQLTKICGDRIPLSYLCAFHLAQKR